MASKDNDQKDSKSLSAAMPEQNKPIADPYNSDVAKLDSDPILYRNAEGKLVPEAHDKHYMEMTLRAGQHSELVQKIMRQRLEQRAKEYPRWPADEGRGVRTLWIESRFYYDRERLLPEFSDEWRNYRAKYLHSLNMDPREPVHIPQYEMELLNPIRRGYMKIGDAIENALFKPWAKDKHHSTMYRVIFTRSLMAYAGAIGLYYWIRYTYKTWEKRNGPWIKTGHYKMLPGHPDYPFKNYRTKPEHFDGNSFLRREIYKDLRDYDDNTCVLK